MKAMQIPEGQKRAEAEARRREITRDTTSMDELQAELKAQRERLNGPKPGFDALMEYLSQVANAPRGISSFAAGAYGAGKQRELEIARQAQQHELTKQMLDVGQKKADIGYQQKMDIYGAGESAEAAAIKDKYAAAINRSTNQFEREKLAQDLDLKLKQLEADKARTAAMNKPETYEKIYAELQRLNPNASKADLLTQATIISGINRTESVDAKNSKAYIDAKEKIDARFQHLINDTPYGKGQKKLYDDAIRDLDATYKIGGGSMKTSAPTVAPIPPGAQPSDLNVGTVYQTSKGAAKWNGKAFEPV
jgi:hypothetical protein